MIYQSNILIIIYNVDIAKLNYILFSSYLKGGHQL